MVDETTPTTDTVAEGGGEQSRPKLQEINERPGQTDPLEARRAAANESDRYGTDDLSVEDGQVRVRERALKREAAAGTPYDAGDLSVEDGQVRVRERALKREAAAGTPYDAGDLSVEDGKVQAPEPTERVDVTLFDPGEGDPAGDVTIVGPDGERRDTGADAGGGEPFFARVDAPDREGTYRVEVGGETVKQFTIGPAGAAVDAPGNLERGWNGTIIDADRDGAGVTQEEYDPDERRSAASADEDVVAGAGAAEALQAGVPVEDLSGAGPVSESEGEQIAERIDGPRPEQTESTRISDPSDLADADDNRRIRERVASELPETSADEVDIVQTGSGPEAVVGGETVTSIGSGGGAPGRQPTDATYSGLGRSVGDRSTGAGTTAALEAARRQVREDVAGQSDRIDKSDVQTEVVDGRVRGTVERDALEVRGQTGRALEGGDVRLQNAATQEDRLPPEGGDVRLQQAADNQRPEQFGDVDWSAGYGGPGDEVEQFVDDDLPQAVASTTRGLDRTVRNFNETAQGTSHPVGIVGTGVVGQSSPAQLGAEFGDDILTMVDDAGRAPGQALEAVETAGYATGQVDNEGDPAPVGGVIGYAADPEQATARGAAVGAAGTKVASKAATYAAENPQDVVTQAIAGAAVSGGTGRAVGTVGRIGIDRVRTAGATKVDLEDVTNPATAEYYNGDGADPDARFPGAEDPELYESDPPEAVRQQAGDYTPAVIEDQFEQAGVTEGVDLKKGIETEPEGPDPPAVGDGAGFRTLEGDYESPGAFAGPELSPNFLGVGERSYSLRPGLPSFGGRPTGVVARTEVEAPDADTLEGFNRELVDDRAGETTARTKPADTADRDGGLNTGEIETIIPPEARFQAVDDVTSGGNRFGVGADFYTEVDGRRVPMRLVAPEDRVDTDAPNVDADADGQRIESYYRAPGESVDRPSPTGVPSGRASSGVSERVRDPVSGSLSDAGDRSGRSSRRDSRRVSDPVSSGFGSAASSGGGSGRSSGGVPTEIGMPTGYSGGGTPTDFNEVGTPTGSGGIGTPTDTYDPREPVTPNPGNIPDPYTPPPGSGDIPDPGTPDPWKTPDPRQFNFEEEDLKRDQIGFDSEKFQNRIATPADFLF